MSDNKSLHLETFLPYRLNVAAAMVSYLIAERCLEPAGITLPQWRIMSMLGEEGSVGQARFVQRSAMDKITISRAVRGLSDRGLVVSTVSAGDRRARLLSLTGKGRLLLRSLSSQARAIERELLARAGEQDGVELGARLRRIEATALALRKIGGNKKKARRK